MQTHDRDGFALRDPTMKCIPRVKKYPIGIHARWAADGHDKLYKIGFPIWAIIEDATGKWLGGWVVPSNRTGNIVAYLWLCTVEKYGGKHRLGYMSIPSLTLEHNHYRHVPAVQYRLWS